MLATRRSKLMVGAVLIVAVLILAVTLNATGNANKAGRPYVGMGDVHLYEALQVAAQTPEPLFSDHPYIGMGDLHYYESLQNADANTPASR